MTYLLKSGFVLLIILTHAFSVFANDQTDSLLSVLDRTLLLKKHYQQQKQKYSDSLRKQLAGQNLTQQYKTDELLFEQYKSFIYDSAFKYANAQLSIAYQLRDKAKINEAKVKVSFTLLSSGMFKEALDTLNSIDESLLNPKARIEYLTVHARTYFDMGDCAQSVHYAQAYDPIGNSYLNQAINLGKPGTTQYLYLKGWQQMRARKIKESIQTFHALLNSDSLTTHTYAIATSSLSFMYRLDLKPERAKEFLAMAAMADIRSAICETVAIRDLAEVLYKEGDIARAHRYVQIALDDAHFYGARQRKIQIADILPIIGAAQLDIIEGQHRDMMYYAIAVTALVLLVIAFLVLIFKQNRKLRLARTDLDKSHVSLQEMNARLKDANKIKEEYIGQFFKIISEHIDKTERVKISIERKIAQKRADEIKEIIAGIDPKSERDQLYFNFDNIFLKIFPHFISQFNTLIKKEDQFIIGANEPLTTELRIFALIRLGIRDNEKIAKILGYSVHTIYTYKTRIKNKSLMANDKFEESLSVIRFLD